MENWEDKFNCMRTPDASVPSHREGLRQKLESGKIPARRGRRAIATLSIGALVMLGALTLGYPSWAKDLINDFLVKTITLRTKDGRNVTIKTMRTDGSAAPCDTACKMIVVRATAEGLKLVDQSQEAFTISSTNNDQTWIINGDTLNANSMTISKGDPSEFPMDLPAGCLDKLTDKTASTQDKFAETPRDFDLRQNYPNPFNPTTKIAFDLKQSCTVTLKVYNMAGQEVATLVNGYTPAGHHAVDFNGSQLASGAYYYTLQTAGSRSSKVMILAK
jgi:hypothetical protein